MHHLQRGLPLTLILLIAGCASLPDSGSRDRTTPPGGGGYFSPASASVGEPIGIFPEQLAQPEHMPSEATDVWERIRAGLDLPAGEPGRVAAEKKRYAGLTGYWQTVSERAEPYLFHITEEIDARNLPMEVALLPIVESAYQPLAYSHGRAAGLWQFIPSTGQHFGLDQNWWYDGRRDVLASTEAALTYLSYLHEFFDGDWLLAFAAYNAGQGTVSRAVARNEAAGRPTDYWSLNLPRETMQYVPRLLAVRDIVRDPDKYEVALMPIDNAPVITAVELEHQFDLALAAELAGIDMETLYQLNPGYNRWASAPDGPHRLLLPLSHAEQFNEQAANLPPQQWMRWQRHRVSQGETLGEIAQRYRISVSALQEANNINGHLIRAGSDLLVPVSSRPTGTTQIAGATQGAERLSHVVQPGESLWVISRRYGVSVDQLANWNAINANNTLRVGEQLTVWSAVSGASDSTSGALALLGADSGPANRLQQVNYTVRPGDSLYRIAERFSVTIADLRRWNNLGSSNMLQPGQRLQLQVDVTATQ